MHHLFQFLYHITHIALHNKFYCGCSLWYFFLSTFFRVYNILLPYLKMYWSQWPQSHTSSSIKTVCGGGSNYLFNDLGWFPVYRKGCIIIINDFPLRNTCANGISLYTFPRIFQSSSFITELFGFSNCCWLLTLVSFISNKSYQQNNKYVVIVYCQI